MVNVKFKYHSIIFIINIFCFSLFAQESTKSTDKDTQKKDNLIHFGDLIDVDILGSTEFDWRGTINPEGFLDGIDFVEEPIHALCQSEEKIAAEVAKGYSKLLRNPQVVVKILDRSGRAVSYLYGAVKTPQRFQIERTVRLNELLIIAGGFDEKASGDIQIIRTNRLNCQDLKVEKNETSNLPINQKEIGTEFLKIKISDIVRGEKESNPIILSGDIITVFEAEPIYIIGGVENPRKINARSQLTVSRAIASAGGFTKNADFKNIVIYRRMKNETQRIIVNYNEIKTNEKADVVLQKFDILEVGVNGNPRNTFNPVVKVFDTQEKPLQLPLRIID